MKGCFDGLRQRRLHIVRVTTSFILFPGLAFGAQAGVIKIWQLKETASAPVLVVGRILAIHKVRPRAHVSITLVTPQSR
jgi:hypothetical protein